MANQTANSKAPANATNKAPGGAKAASAQDDMPDFDKWTDRQIGFAPYWSPDPANFIYGKIIAKDARNPEFVRYLVKAYKDMDCRTGPQNENADEGPVGEPVLVKKGQTFSMSVYYALQDEFDFQLWLNRTQGADIPVRVDAVKKVATKTEGRKVWKFRVRCAPENVKILESHQDEWRRLQEGGEERPQMEG